MYIYVYRPLSLSLRPSPLAGRGGAWSAIAASSSKNATVS